MGLAGKVQERDTVGDWWGELLEQRRDSIMLCTRDTTITFAEIDQRASSLARGLLLRGVGKGSHVGLLMPNGADWIVCWLAIERIGAVAVMLSTLFAPPELAQVLEHSDVEILLTTRSYLGHDYEDRVERAVPQLRELGSAAPLRLAAAPCLREIYFDGPADRAWCTGTLAQLEAAGAANAAMSDADPLVRAEEGVCAQDIAMLLYTSGSTALPKAVLHRHGTIVTKIRYMAEINCIIPANVEAGDCLLLGNPLFWVGGFLSCFAALQRGATIAFTSNHTAGKLWEEIDLYGATHVTGPEAMLRTLQDHPLAAGRRVEHVLKPQNTSQTVFIRGLQGYDRSQIGQSIGMTETFGPHCGPRSLDETYGALAGTWGWPLPGMELRITDPDTGAPCLIGQPGELRVRGCWLMAGYYKKSEGEIFDREGYFATGDLCVRDAQGRVNFLGRISGMIKTSGANVAPEEVELALRRHEGIVEAVVIGLPDPERGQIVVAGIVATPDSQLSEAEIRGWLKDRLSSFKVPRRIVFIKIEDLPRTSSNKINRRAIHEIMSRAVAASSSIDP